MHTHVCFLSHDGVGMMTIGFEHCILKMSSSFRMEGSWTLMQFPSLLKVHNTAHDITWMEFILYV